MKRHARELCRLVRETVGEPACGAEVGVWRGHTSLALLQSFPDLHLYAVDPWETGGDQSTMGDDAGRLVEAREEFDRLILPESFRVTTLAMTSIEAASTNGWRGQGWHKGLDFVFIDGCHKYESVRDDVRAWWPKVRRGGIICGHDYGGVGDRTGRFGVRRAVDEWASEVGVIIGTRPGLIWWARR